MTRASLALRNGPASSDEPGCRARTVTTGQAGGGREAGVFEDSDRSTATPWTGRSVLNCRFTLHRWPADRRREKVSHKVHSILASIQDDAERFEAIDDPPVDDVTGTRRWTTNLAKKRVGRRPDRPGTVQEKVERVHDLATDEEVAVEVTRDVLRRPQVAAWLMEDTATRRAINDAQMPEHRAEAMQALAKDNAAAARMASDVLRRPEVAARVAADDRARRMVNRAQADRSRQQAESFRRTSPVGPALRRVERTEEFVVITRETAGELLARMTAGDPGEAVRDTPSSVAEEVSPFAGAERWVVGVLAVPKWRPGLEPGVLPRVYQDILEVVGDAPGPVRAKQIVPRIGLPAETAKIEGTRSKLKRLFERGRLDENSPGLFTPSRTRTIGTSNSP